MKGVKARTVDEYLSALSADKRVALEQLRRDIHSAAPGAEECISYSMPAVRWKGKVLVWFGASTSHCAFYPGAVVQTFARELTDYKIAKGTIRFAPDERLPAPLVKKLVKARMASIAAK
jgi:uncharacterized protein YdhG (YjbR/CyaY superfamily)